MQCGPNPSVAPSRFSRVGSFSRALAFRSLFYPWGKMGTTRSLDSIISRCSVTRELKQRRRQQWKQRHPKSEFALFQTSLLLSQPFNLSNDGYVFFKSWILKGCVSSRKKKEIGVLCSRKIRKFHVVIVQRRQRNVQKKTWRTRNVVVLPI